LFRISDFEFRRARLDTGTIMGAEELVPRPRQSNL